MCGYTVTAGHVLVHCDCVRQQADQQLLSRCGSIYYCLSRLVPEIHTACCWDVKQPRNNDIDGFDDGCGEDTAPRGRRTVSAHLCQARQVPSS